RRSVAEDREGLPLRELWEGWWASRSAKTRDADGLELVRAAQIATGQVREGEEETDDWEDDEDDDVPESSLKDDPAVAAAGDQVALYEGVKVPYEPIIDALMEWFNRLYPPQGGADFILDAAETGLALVPPSVLDRLPRTEEDDAKEEDDSDEDEDNNVVEWR